MEIAFLLIGIAIGSISVWLIARAIFKRNTGVSSEDYFALDRELAVLKNETALLKEQLQQKAAELQEKTTGLTAANDRLARAEEVFKAQEEKLTLQKNYYEEKLLAHKNEMEQLQKKLTTEFENIANRVLDEKSQKFTEQNRVNLDIILNPLKEKIRTFEQKVEETYKADSAERITLKTEIRSLVEMNKQISDEANNLARALKGDNKKQGNWGEIILEKILERSGLLKGQEYKIQVSSTNDEGKRIQPDVVIYLPDNKHIIIDSKVSLLAYEAYVNSEDEEQKEILKKEHLRSIREHIRALSEKNYQSSLDFNAPDFVMLFVPIESSFSVAVQADQELFGYSWDRKIVIVSPSTLLASLKTIASIWKQERQTRNAIEIASQSGALYDKFVGLLEDLGSIGTKLDAARDSYSQAMNKLSTGTGNLIKRVQTLKELGAKANKAIPEKFIDSPITQQGILKE
jgi:DNA recombination protein RmuC